MRPVCALVLVSAIASGTVGGAPAVPAGRAPGRPELSATAPGDGLSLLLAEAFDRKLAAVLQHGATPSRGPRTTRFTERELNSYLRFKAADQLPTGLTEPVVTLRGSNRVSARAIVDLDLIRRNQSTGRWLDPVSYLAGRISIEADGLVHTADGKGRVEVERVTALGIPVPKLLLQQILTFYSSTPDDPDGASLDDTYVLPAQIKRLEIGPARVAVVQ